jgi:hypothetical protein
LRALRRRRAGPSAGSHSRSAPSRAALDKVALHVAGELRRALQPRQHLAVVLEVGQGGPTATAGVRAGRSGRTGRSGRSGDRESAGARTRALQPPVMDDRPRAGRATVVCTDCSRTARARIRWQPSSTDGGEPDRDNGSSRRRMRLCP